MSLISAVGLQKVPGQSWRETVLVVEDWIFKVKVSYPEISPFLDHVNYSGNCAAQLRVYPTAPESCPQAHRILLGVD